MRGIILEGISASGKSTILNLIQKRILEERPASTKLFISEHYTQRMLEHELEAHNLTSKQVKLHAERIIRNLNVYQSMLDKSKFAERPSGADTFVTIERFLFTFLATQSNKLGPYSVIDVERQLNKLSKMNIRQYLLVLSEEKLKEHISRTLTHRNKQWADYVDKKGGADGIVKESMEWQENFLKLADKYKHSIKTEIIPVKDWDYGIIADTIFNNEYRD